jgi:hypothetical protein
MVMLLASVAVANAQEKTENLLWQCLGEMPVPDVEMIGKLACSRYMSGVLDMHSIAVGVSGARPIFCTPASGISAEQAMRIFVKWATDNPAELHKSARTSLLVALKKAFPCPSESAARN